MNMNKIGHRLGVLFLVCAFFLGTTNGFALGHVQEEKVVLLDFLALDDQGDYIDTRNLSVADLTNLSRVMSQGIAARLVQYGEFEVHDSISLGQALDELGFAFDTSAWDRAEAVLT